MQRFLGRAFSAGGLGVKAPGNSKDIIMIFYKTFSVLNMYMDVMGTDYLLRKNIIVQSSSFDVCNAHSAHASTLTTSLIRVKK